MTYITPINAVDVQNLPTGAISQTIARNTHFDATAVAGSVSGVEIYQTVSLSIGATIRTITFLARTSAVTPTNQWFALRDSNRNLLAITNDGLTTAWASDTFKTLTLTTPKTITSSGFYYITYMVAAATVPGMYGIQAVFSSLFLGQTLTGSDNTNTGLTTPATAPTVGGAIVGSSQMNYGYCS